MIGIYKITNKNNGKVYIGQSNNCERRILEHQQERSIPIDIWINIIGKENFDYEILEECSLEELDEKEKYYIGFYDSIKEGYNIQEGGFNNSIGEGNGRARLTIEDVKEIRLAYKNHSSPKEVYEKYKNKISYSHFQGVWQGRSWSNIMPEVYTEENKKYYISGINKTTALLTKEEVLQYRHFYIKHTIEEVCDKVLKDKGEDFLKRTTIKKIITGDVRDNSIYKEIPIYSKKRKQWELKGKPVSTILGSEE